MKTQCPKCMSKFNIGEANIGKQARCPKCREPFTIQPFVETPGAANFPAAVEAPPKQPQPQVPPITKPERVSPPVKSPESVAPPVTKPQPVTTSSKRDSAESSAFKSPGPISPPVQKAAPPAKPVEPVKQEQPESKAVSKSSLSKVIFIYVWMILRVIAGAVAGFGLMQLSNKAPVSTLNLIFAAADVFLLLSVAIEFSLFYKMWSAIKDKEISTTGLKAVIFLLIPGFNIYWALLMITGFPEDYNSYIRRRNIQTKELSITPYLIYACLFILTGLVLILPMLCIFALYRYIYIAFTVYKLAGWLITAFVLAIGLGHFLAYILFASKTCNAANALQDNTMQ
jgi:hypothetical protein